MSHIYKIQLISDWLMRVVRSRPPNFYLHQCRENSSSWYLVVLFQFNLNNITETSNAKEKPNIQAPYNGVIKEWRNHNTCLISIQNAKKIGLLHTERRMLCLNYEPNWERQSMHFQPMSKDKVRFGNVLNHLCMPHEHHHLNVIL